MTRRSSSCRAQSWYVLVLTLYLGSLSYLTAPRRTTGRAHLPAMFTGRPPRGGARRRRSVRRGSRST